jgi:outer membrane protein OmpA-like peptidoglycan-associated protein
MSAQFDRSPFATLATARPTVRCAGLLTALSLAALLVACQSVPDRNMRLEEARAAVSTARSETLLQRHAAVEMRAAGTALERADAAQKAGADAAEVEHLAYLASRRVVVARETSAAREAESVVEGARVERDAMRLALRTAEADAAQRQLAASQQQGAAKDMALAQASREVANTRAEVASSRAEVAQSEARADDLEAQLKKLNARRTERGIVVTLGDMLFASGNDRVLATGAGSVSGLAEFMRRNPTRQASVEGYTDSQGSDSANQALSERRADAVRSMLVGMGIDTQRLKVVGHGESSPVADNDTDAGRRSNRRVEIVFAGEGADLLRR